MAISPIDAISIKKWIRRLAGGGPSGGGNYATKAELSALDTRITSLENLGSFLCSFNTFAEVRNNVSYYPVITINDFITVQRDESRGNATTGYRAKAIANGVVTWEYFITYSPDITGKQDKVTATGITNLLTAPASAGGQPGTKPISDFAKATVYSTNEVDTGKTWIDGKPIYRRVFTGTITAAAGVRTLTSLMGGVSAVINTGGYVNSGGSTYTNYPLGFLQLDGYNEYVNIAHNHVGNLLLISNVAIARTNAPYQVWAEYTK